MSSYTVKQIADMFKTNEETVRRWIRSGKLAATQNSKKSGNIVSSAVLDQFIKKTPKYASVVATSFAASPVAMSFIVGSLLGGLLALIGEKKDTISKADVEEVLKKKIVSHDKNLKIKKAELRKIQMEIEEEQQNLDKYKYALEHLDLELIASEINKKK